MALKAGIVGLPNVGKSTLFNALTSAKALAANYPFATKDPNVGIITVPDARLDTLYEIVNPKALLPTSIEIVDIAGLIKGASKGEGLGNQFLANIRECDAIVQVVRCFHDDNIVHVDGGVDPVRDKGVIDTELILKDIETVEKRLDRLRKAAKTGAKQEVHLVTVGEAIMAHLNEGKPARSMKLEGDDLELLEDMLLMTAKPILYVCNVDEASVHSGNEFTAKFMEAVKDEPAEVIFISAAIEAEIAQMETKEERNEYLEMIGLKEPGVNRLIHATYKLLDLITYFTVGEKEVRAWTIHRGWKAPKAASVIHTDFEKGFIRAEVIKYDDYVKYRSEAAIKEAGKMGVEGKEYVVQDGDCMHFRFNV